MKYRGKQCESHNTHTCSTSKISRQIVILQGYINNVLMPWANLLPILVICPCRRKDFQDLKRAMVQIFMKLKSIQILSMVKYCRKLLSKIQQVSSHFINHETRISYLKSRKDPLIVVESKMFIFFFGKVNSRCLPRAPIAMYQVSLALLLLLLVAWFASCACCCDACLCVYVSKSTIHPSMAIRSALEHSFSQTLNCYNSYNSEKK